MGKVLKRKIYMSKTLVICKKSAYQIYCLEKKNRLYTKGTSFHQKEMQYFMAAHLEHYKTLKFVKDNSFHWTLPHLSIGKF